MWKRFAPRPLLPGDDWSDTYRKLSKGESPRPGQWRTAFTPYLREPLRAFTDTPGQILWVLATDFPALAVEHGCWSPTTVAEWIAAGGRSMLAEDFPAPYRLPADEDDVSPIDLVALPWTQRNELLVLMGSRQWGKTNFLLNCIGLRMHLKPCGILITQPTDQLTKRFSRKKLAPMLRDTPVLAGLVTEQKAAARDAANAMAMKEFPGGAIGIASAGSPAGLRMDSVEFYAADEIDGYESSSGDEGDAFELASEMTQAFYYTRKLLVTSTPLLQLSSRIEPMYKAGTQEQWALSCPHCHAFQVVRFDDRLDHQTLQYACAHCGATSGEWEWKQRPGLYLSGNPLAATHRSFHLQAMYSPFKPWQEIVAQYHKATKARREGNPKLYQVFVNCVLGETYQETGEALTVNAFVKNKHAYGCDVPRGVLALTCTGDTQDNRLELEVRGWGLGFESWGIQYLIIPGTMDQPAIRAQLDGLLMRTWRREDGAQLPISIYGQDAMGHWTDHVYEFTRPRKGRNVYALRGAKDYGAALIDRLTDTNRKGLKTPLFHIGTQMGKDMVYHRLQVDTPGPGFCHWPEEAYLQDGITPRGYDEAYFAQLTHEHRVKRIVGGRPVEVWQPKRGGLAVEAWDLLVYNLAMIMVYGGENILNTLAVQQQRIVLPTPTMGVMRPGQGRRVISGGVGV